MTYTVTDVNGVSDSGTFTLTVASGSNAPTSSPTVSVASVNGGTALLEWEELAGVTSYSTGVPGATSSGYVVQVRAADEAYPSQAIPFLQAGALSRALRLDSPVRTTDDGSRIATFDVSGLTDGNYKARVAAFNESGAGP